MKVVIGGLLPKQQRQIERTCPRNLKVRFLGTEVAAATWGAAATHADVCIAFVRFISHKHAEQWQHHPRVIHHTGGLTGLRAVLEELSNE